MISESLQKQLNEVNLKEDKASKICDYVIRIHKKVTRAWVMKHAMRHHPDKGGRTDSFQAISDAVRLSTYQKTCVPTYWTNHAAYEVLKGSYLVLKRDLENSCQAWEAAETVRRQAEADAQARAKAEADAHEEARLRYLKACKQSIEDARRQADAEARRQAEADEARRQAETRRKAKAEERREARRQASPRRLRRHAALRQAAVEAADDFHASNLLQTLAQDYKKQNCNKKRKRRVIDLTNEPDSDVDATATEKEEDAANHWNTERLKFNDYRDSNPYDKGLMVQVPVGNPGGLVHVPTIREHVMSFFAQKSRSGTWQMRSSVLSGLSQKLKAKKNTVRGQSTVLERHGKAVVYTTAKGWYSKKVDGKIMYKVVV